MQIGSNSTQVTSSQVVGTTQGSSSGKSVPDAVNAQQQLDLQAETQKNAVRSNADLTGLGQNLDTRA